MVEDLLWLVREQPRRARRAARARLGASSPARGRRAGLLRGGLQPRRGRARGAPQRARASCTPTTCTRRSAGARSPRRAAGGRARGAAPAPVPARVRGRRVLHPRRRSARAATGATRSRACACNCRGSVPEARRLRRRAGALAAAPGRRSPTRCSCPSRFARERLRELGAPLPVGARARARRRRCRPRPRDAPAIRREPAARGARRYALVVSRLAPEKGVDVAIEACRRRGCRSWSPARAPSAGALRERSRGAPTCASLGASTTSELARLRAGAALALVPSRSAETFGLAAPRRWRPGCRWSAAASGRCRSCSSEDGARRARATRGRWRRRSRRAGGRPRGRASAGRGAIARAVRAREVVARACARSTSRPGRARAAPARKLRADVRARRAR